MTPWEEGRGYLHRDNQPASQPAQQLCRTPQLMPGNYKKLKIPDVSSAPSDLVALVCLALRRACLKQHSEDRVTSPWINKRSYWQCIPVVGPEDVSPVIWDSFSVSNLRSAWLCRILCRCFTAQLVACPQSHLSHARGNQSSSMLSVMLGVPLFAAPAWVGWPPSFILGTESTSCHACYWGTHPLKCIERLWLPCGLCIRSDWILLEVVGWSRRLQFFDSCCKFLGSVNLIWLWKTF